MLAGQRRRHMEFAVVCDRYQGGAPRTASVSQRFGIWRALSGWESGKGCWTSMPGIRRAPLGHGCRDFCARDPGRADYQRTRWLAVTRQF